MDVVSLFSAAGHSPACFWIGGFESDPENVVFSWNISAKAMDKYFIEWESGYPKNRWGTAAPGCTAQLLLSSPLFVAYSLHQSVRKSQ